MNLTQEQRETVANELKKFGTELGLSDAQKEKFQGFLAESYSRLQEFKNQNPNAVKEDLIKRVAAHRAQLREKLVGFLTPEQLQKWDSGVAKAKEFLGQKIAA
jgi:hypothetical protein